MDFSIFMYKKLLCSALEAGYSFQAMEDYIESPIRKKVFVLRHDVDERPHNALKLAEAESELNVRATYYFRIVKISNCPDIIDKIVELGHEIGYHYEDLSTAGGDLEAAIENFKANLNYFRKFYPVKTVCMHGSSMSDYNNSEMWRSYSLKDFDIIGEPYLTIDYSNVLYLTDTGRCWDGDRYSVRDSVKSSYRLSFHRTSDILMALSNQQLPAQVVLQSHTLWTDSVKEWLWLECREQVRNRAKILIVKFPWLKQKVYQLIRLYSK